jgi:hypothetical protein
VSTSKSKHHVEIVGLSVGAGVAVLLILAIVTIICCSRRNYYGSCWTQINRPSNEDTVTPPNDSPNRTQSPPTKVPSDESDLQSTLPPFRDWITRPVQKDSHDRPGALIRSAAKMINWWIELQFFSFCVVHHIIPFFYHRYSKTFDEVSTRGGAIVIDKLISYMLLLTVQAEQEVRDCESLILQVYTMYFLFPVLVLYFLCCSFFLLSSVSPYLEVFDLNNKKALITLFWLSS